MNRFLGRSPGEKRLAPFAVRTKPCRADQTRLNVCLRLPCGFLTPRTNIKHVVRIKSTSDVPRKHTGFNLDLVYLLRGRWGKFPRDIRIRNWAGPALVKFLKVKRQPFERENTAKH